MTLNELVKLTTLWTTGLNARADVKMVTLLDREKLAMLINCCCTVWLFVREKVYVKDDFRYNRCSEMHTRVVANGDIWTNRRTTGHQYCTYLLKQVQDETNLSESLFTCSTIINKMLFSMQKYWYFFLFLHKNVCCGYSLEVCLITHNIRFHGEIKKK